MPGRSFLELHCSLRERLGAFRVTYVTDQRRNRRAAEEAFERFTEDHWPRAIRYHPSLRERILSAFRAEKMLRSGQIYRLEEYERRRIEGVESRLTPARYEALRDVWAQTSDEAVYDLVAPEPHELWPRGDLEVHYVRRNYRWLYPG